MAARAGHKTPALARILDSIGKFIRARRDRPTKNGSCRRNTVLVFLIEFLAADLLVGHLRELDQEVDHLFLKQGRAHARQRLWVLAVIIPHLLLAAGNLA